MRRRFAIPLIAAIAAAPWLWFYPDAPPADQPAQLSSAVPIPKVADWVGGVSGIEVSDDGTAFFAVTDRGYLMQGTLTRTKGGVLSGVSVTDNRLLAVPAPKSEQLPRTDAEGLAQSDEGTLFVSFEHLHRIMTLDRFDSTNPIETSHMPWYALPKNGGLEALAIHPDGTLFALPEAIARGATQALVYRQRPGQPWEQPFTLPVDRAFKPVGADFGPDGYFYLLERGLYSFGFYSRVRRMQMTEAGVRAAETVLHTPLFRHGNIEGLSVWADADGAIRLTLVVDDNFLPLARGDIIEYSIGSGVAPTGEGQ